MIPYLFPSRSPQGHGVTGSRDQLSHSSVNLIDSNQQEYQDYQNKIEVIHKGHQYRHVIFLNFFTASPVPHLGIRADDCRSWAPPGGPGPAVPPSGEGEQHSQRQMEREVRGDIKGTFLSFHISHNASTWTVWKSHLSPINFSQEVEIWKARCQKEEEKGDSVRKHLSRTERELYSILQRKHEFMRGAAAPSSAAASPSVAGGAFELPISQMYSVNNSKNSSSNQPKV